MYRTDMYQIIPPCDQARQTDVIQKRREKQTWKKTHKST